MYPLGHYNSINTEESPNIKINKVYKISLVHTNMYKEISRYKYSHAKILSFIILSNHMGTKYLCLIFGLENSELILVTLNAMIKMTLEQMIVLLFLSSHML